MKPIDLEVVFEVDSLPHIKTLISEGHGYSILAHAAIADELRKGKLAAAPITNITLRRSVYIVRNPAQVVTRASVLLADLLTSLMWEMIEQGEWLASRPATPT